MVTNTSGIVELVETGERRDRRGRRITPAGRRDELLTAWRQSGLTQAEFARREGVRYPTFATWVQQARQAAEGRQPAPPMRFVEVQAAAKTAASALEVHLPDGTVVRGGSSREVAAVVRALRA